MFFKSIDNCLNEELCDKLIAEFITNPNKAVFNNQDQAFSDRVLHFQNIADPLKTQIAQMALEVARIIPVKVWPETVSIVSWDNGQEMLLHKDGQQPNTINRTHSALIYLTNNESGEIYFPNLEKEFKPQKGLLLAFDKNESHGVKPISDAPRYTLSMWFTDKREHAIIAEA